MRLIEVLDQFPEEINDIVDAIKYADDPGAYEIRIALSIDDNDREWQYMSVILFDGGETTLYVSGDYIDNEDQPWIWDNVIDTYSKVKECWKSIW